MEIIGNRKYFEIPGGSTHELPPLLLKESANPASDEEMIHLAEEIVSSESLIPDDVHASSYTEASVGQRRFTLALTLAEQYARFLRHWEWGESILEWIHQCEITFEAQPILRPLIRPDVWPHAGHASFVTLLSDKAIPSGPVNLESAVGARLTFRQPPPIDCLSDKFLYLLNISLAQTAYDTWADAAEAISLPPERFHFLVMGSEIREV